MATFKIKEIYRDKINTKYGEKEFIKLVPESETVTDINGDEIKLDGRKISGFRDRNGETDKWERGTTIKVQVTIRSNEGKEFVNFKLPEGKSSIVEAAPKEGDVNLDDF